MLASIFSMINLIAIVSWALLIFLPKWRWTFALVVSGGISAILGILYIYFLVTALSGGLEMDFSSLAAVKALFQDDTAVLIGWAHYLAFDLFVGSWIVSNAQREGINHWWTVPCLLLTFMAGPTGLVLYFILRGIVTKKMLHENF